MINLYAAWLGILGGCIAGAVQGLFFHKDGWLDGYGSWRRRLTRLGHISFFGIGFINLAFAVSLRMLEMEGELVVSSRLLIVALITMPLLCYLSAFKKPFRNLFFIPAGSVIVAILLFLWRIIEQ